MIPAGIIAGHHWSTLLTATFMHASWWRLLGNMIFLMATGNSLFVVRDVIVRSS